MAKFAGKIGYFNTVEEPDGSGIWVQKVIEKTYKGDLTRNNRRLESISSKVNEDIRISNSISILGDPYAFQNFHSIIYVEFMGTKWRVESVEVNYPRLDLSLGGVWNGETED